MPNFIKKLIKSSASPVRDQPKTKASEQIEVEKTLRRSERSEDFSKYFQKYQGCETQSSERSENGEESSEYKKFPE